jgi:hypothetical protein
VFCSGCCQRRPNQSASSVCPQATHLNEIMSAFPVAINNSGEVVLQLAGSYKLYLAGLPLVDISASLLSSSNNQWVADNETNVPAINDLGQIAVTAQLNGAGADHVILMSVRR